MTAGSHITLQAILTAIQGLNLANLTGYTSFLPPKWAAVLMFALTTLQGGIGIYNHYFHPDGTKLPAA